MRKRLLLALGALSYAGVGHAGGKVGKVVVGAAAGFVTGSAAFLVTGAATAAVETGVTTAASVATRGIVPARVGVTASTNGDLRSVDASIGRGANSGPIVRTSFESRERREKI